MKNVKVVVEVKAAANMDLYVCGSCKAFGEWNPKKACKLEYNASSSTYKVGKMLAEDQVVDFKVLAGTDWDFVEKAVDGSEVENHTFVTKKGLVVKVEVNNFNLK